MGSCVQENILILEFVFLWVAYPILVDDWLYVIKWHKGTLITLIDDGTPGT